MNSAAMPVEPRLAAGTGGTDRPPSTERNPADRHGPDGHDPGGRDPGGRERDERDHRHYKAVLEAPDIRRAVTRIAHEILERTKGGHGIVLLGIPTRGAPLARRLSARMGEVEGTPPPFGSL